VVGRNAHDSVVHLLNFSGLQRNTVGAPITIPDSRLIVAGEIDRAASLTTGETLAVTFDGTDSAIQLQPLGLFEVIVLSRPAA
jgi:hypothetical protein